ncbi:hypothetical protein ARMGADRAFT_1031993 [Armillaria gallica]|uniref:Uncharacterized protein n=1 Tax=Armillaria gallica TaxID=47427 RepID=A0A2H3DTX1_ARMGA|nr:hypothetical protein ARMGADRAFT_1031993 [Armillaria gallica]
MQTVYMLEVKALLNEEEKRQDSDEAALVADEVKLWMSSQNAACAKVNTLICVGAEISSCLSLMVALKEEGCGEFKTLKGGDIAPMHEVESDAKATKCLGHVSSWESRAQVRPSSQKMSWIWTVMGGKEMDQGVHESFEKQWGVRKNGDRPDVNDDNAKAASNNDYDDSKQKVEGGIVEALLGGQGAADKP